MEKLNKIKVLDIGADRNFIKTLFKNLKDFIEYNVIDPLPDFLAKLKKENENSKNLKIKTYNYCLAKNKTNKNFYVNFDPTTSSYFKSNLHLLDLIRDDKFFKNRKKINLKTTNLSTIFRKHKIKKIDIMSLYTQGSELDIIKGSHQYLKNISLLRVQGDWVLKYLNEPLIGELIAFLIKKNFILLTISPAVTWYDKSISSDILFINKRIVLAKSNSDRVSLKKALKILLSLGKITDVLIILRTNNLPIKFIEKELKNANRFYKYIIHYYPYSKIFAYTYNSIIKLLNIIGFRKISPNFFSLFKFLKIHH